ncbi:MAG: hypothetical protein ACE5J3_09025 [Methanosarcinales archaeon]
MLGLQKICNLDFISSVLQEGEDIDNIIETLVLKADEEAENVKELEELEGKSIKDGNLRILKECPMMPVLAIIKKENLAETGKEELPVFYGEIVKKYIEHHPDEAAVLHPLCIVHQAMRDIIGSQKGHLTRQVACRSCDTGKVVFAKNGLSLANLTEEQAKDKIEGYACMYIQKEL